MHNLERGRLGTLDSPFPDCCLLSKLSCLQSFVDLNFSSVQNHPIHRLLFFQGWAQHQCWQEYYSNSIVGNGMKKLTYLTLDHKHSHKHRLSFIFLWWSKKIREGLKKCGFIHIWVGGWFRMGTKSTKKPPKNNMFFVFNHIWGMGGLVRSKCG